MCLCLFLIVSFARVGTRSHSSSSTTSGEPNMEVEDEVGKVSGSIRTPAQLAGFSFALYSASLFLFCFAARGHNKDDVNKEDVVGTPGTNPFYLVEWQYLLPFRQAPILSHWGIPCLVQTRRGPMCPFRV